MSINLVLDGNKNLIFDTDKNAVLSLHEYIEAVTNTFLGNTGQQKDTILQTGSAINSVFGLGRFPTMLPLGTSAYFSSGFHAQLENMINLSQVLGIEDLPYGYPESSAGFSVELHVLRELGKSVSHDIDLDHDKTFHFTTPQWLEETALFSSSIQVALEVTKSLTNTASFNKQDDTESGDGIEFEDYAIFSSYITALGGIGLHVMHTIQFDEDESGEANERDTDINNAVSFEQAVEELLAHTITNGLTTEQTIQILLNGGHVIGSTITFDHDYLVEVKAVPAVTNAISIWHGFAVFKMGG